MRGPGSGTFANPVPPLQGSAATCLAPRVSDARYRGISPPTLSFSVSPLRGLPDPPVSCWLLRPLSRAPSIVQYGAYHTMLGGATYCTITGCVNFDCAAGTIA